MLAPTLLAALALGASLAARPALDAPRDTAGRDTAGRDTATRADSTVLAARALPTLLPGSVDSVVVEKGARRLTLYAGGLAVRAYRVALGSSPVGPKRLRGDGRTPEGLYVIDRRNAQSRYYRSLHISYPNAVDRFLAAEKGLTAGGDVMVHGLPAESAHLGAAHAQYDWTEGCVALTNREIDEMWTAVADGTVIRIKP